VNYLGETTPCFLRNENRKKNNFFSLSFERKKFLKKYFFIFYFLKF